MYDELYNEYFIFSLLFSGRRGSLREVFRFSVVETQSQVSRLNLEPQLGLLLTAGQDRQIRIWSSVSPSLYFHLFPSPPSVSREPQMVGILFLWVCFISISHLSLTLLSSSPLTSFGEYRGPQMVSILFLINHPFPLFTFHLLPSPPDAPSITHPSPFPS